jgi:hypothetical protein
MFNIFSHEGNENQSYIDVRSHPSENDNLARVCVGVEEHYYTLLVGI